jgi:hypothetical protein
MPCIRLAPFGDNGLKDTLMTKSSNKRGKQTVELPAVTLAETPEDDAGAVAEAAPADVDDPRKTRELEAIGPGDAAAAREDDSEGGDEGDSEAMDDLDTAAHVESETGPAAEMSEPVATAQPQGAEDPDATIQRAAIESAESSAPDRPRHHTLAAITRPRGGTNPYGAPPPPDAEEPGFTSDAIADETDYASQDEAEWSLADQPTVALTHGSVLGARPQFLDTDEHAHWPPRPTPDTPFPASQPEAAASLHRRAIPRTDRTGLRRYASPNGRPMPGAPPAGIPRTAIPDPRMQRYQELHRRRDASENGERDPDADKRVTERVRQWWGDLRPGLKKALEYQHEVRASGVHPIPAYEPTEPSPSSRLGDVFGRLTASARGLTERAQSAATPTFRRLHDQAEQAAQAIVGRFETDPIRQQAPFLGPGRVAVFFRSGVSVGQAQRLLSSNEARPLRIIPRKHGFLAYVLPGTEEQVSSRLRVHPYVRDVVFMPVDAYGDAADEDEG